MLSSKFFVDDTVADDVTPYVVRQINFHFISYLNQWINQPCVSHGMSLVEEKGFDFRNQWKVEGFDGFVWMIHACVW